MHTRGVAVAVIASVLMASSAAAMVVCVKDSPRGSAVRVRPQCKAREITLGSFEALLGLLASTSGDPAAPAVEFSGEVKFYSPVGGGGGTLAPAAVSSPQVSAQQQLSGQSYCRQGGFPGELGNEHTCASGTDCNAICVAGDDGRLGSPCVIGTDCDTAGLADGVCASGAICQEFAVLSLQGTDAYFSGFNVHIRNGMGATATTNALGNLIVGYNEPFLSSSRTGSHNLVVGLEHTYESFGGFVAGRKNSLAAPFASVSGGHDNSALGTYGSVSGGQRNDAIGPYSSVSGGGLNAAMGNNASVSGGWNNLASGDSSSVSGGAAGHASGNSSSVSGGVVNEASGIQSSVSGGRDNVASGDSSSVSGGEQGLASGYSSSVGGGLGNEASGFQSSVSGGQSGRAIGSSASVSGGILNTASGPGSAVSGGEVNTASAQTSAVSGGAARQASGPADWVAGGLFQNN